MLTILAWIVFVLAVAWNAIFFGIVLSDLMTWDMKYFRNWRNYVQAVFSFALMFVPGVYLFGVY